MDWFLYDNGLRQERVNSFMTMEWFLYDRGHHHENFCFIDNLLCRLFNKEELLAFTSTLLTQTFQNLLGVGLFIYCNDFFLLRDKSSVVFLGFLYLQVLYLILQILVSSLLRSHTKCGFMLVL